MMMMMMMMMITIIIIIIMTMIKEFSVTVAGYTGSPKIILTY